jgi:hypothetical protein
MLMKALLLAMLCVSCLGSLFYSPCSESTARVCPQGSNVTDRLLNLKKGGQNCVTQGTYQPQFYLCDEYNYNCGYMEASLDFLTLGEGVQLNLTTAELAQVVPSDATLRTLVTPYLGANGSRATCLSNFFPLILTDTQSDTFMNGFLTRLASNLSALYNANKAGSSLSWASLPTNIVTAVLEVAKLQMNANFLASSAWSLLLGNNWIGLASDFRASYGSLGKVEYLRCAYLVESVGVTYNKYQSVNFLADESATVGAGNFAQITAFLSNFVTHSNDDPALMSVSYYDLNRDPLVAYSSANTQSSIASAISGKSCRCAGSSNLGSSLNATVASILARNFPSGVNKVVVAVVGSTSLDDVAYASEYARALGITLVVIAVGGSYSSSQLLSVTSTSSNLLLVPTFAQLATFHTTFANFLNKQFVDVLAGSSQVGAVVRVPSNPNYYRVARSSVAGTYYKVTLTYATDPTLGNAQVYISHYDPFPDQLSDCNCTEHYRTSVYTY